ncbi:MAG: MFS transporter [Anaerolineales bacterium]|nr:MFS transporter [Anaerolineales bacterium]
MVSWKRNLYIVTAAEMVAVAGFTIVMPFLPFYVQELGITDPNQVKLWTGWLFAAQAVTMAIMAPIWGSLSDRYGRKIMLERAMFGGAILFFAMGFVRSIEWLLILRALQGMVTGTVPAAMALVASTTPKGRSGRSLGILQTGIYLGASLGPFAGGLLADTFGYQSAFLVTSACLGLAGLGVWWMVHDEFGKEEKLAQEDGSLWEGLKLVISSAHLRAVFAVRLTVRLSGQIVGPMLPLFVQQLVDGPVKLATITGTISGAGALAGAAGAVILGKKADEIGHRKMLLLCTLGLTIMYIPQTFVANPFQVGVLQAVASFIMAGVLASVAALLATLVPPGRQGIVYGVNTTILAVANALAPTIGAFVAVWLGLRSMFVVAAALFFLGTILVTGFMPVQAGLQRVGKNV